MAKDQYVAVCNGQELFAEFDPIVRNRDHEFDKKQMCGELVRKLKLTTPRNNPQAKVKVQVFKLVIEKGELKRIGSGTYDIQLTMERMTEAQYTTELAEILSDLPAEFHPYIREESWDRGHSAGHEEVINYARGMVESLLPCLVAFCKNRNVKF